MKREEDHFSEHEYRSEIVEGIWILGPRCQTRAGIRCGDLVGLGL